MPRREFVRSLIFILAIMSMANMTTLAETADVSVMVPARLNGVTFEPGRYKISWQTHSPEVTVTFSKGNKEIVTAEGKLVERDTKYRNNMVVYRTNSDGTNTILEIRFRGKNQVIVFGE